MPDESSISFSSHCVGEMFRPSLRTRTYNCPIMHARQVHCLGYEKIRRVATSTLAARRLLRRVRPIVLGLSLLGMGALWGSRWAGEHSERDWIWREERAAGKLQPGYTGGLTQNRRQHGSIAKTALTSVVFVDSMHRVDCLRTEPRHLLAPTPGPSEPPASRS